MKYYIPDTHTEKLSAKGKRVLRLGILLCIVILTNAFQESRPSALLVTLDIIVFPLGDYSELNMLKPPSILSNYMVLCVCPKFIKSNIKTLTTATALFTLSAKALRTNM